MCGRTFRRRPCPSCDANAALPSAPTLGTGSTRWMGSAVPASDLPRVMDRASGGEYRARQLPAIGNRHRPRHGARALPVDYRCGTPATDTPPRSSTGCTATPVVARNVRTSGFSPTSCRPGGEGVYSPSTRRRRRSARQRRACRRSAGSDPTTEGKADTRGWTPLGLALPRVCPRVHGAAPPGGRTRAHLVSQAHRQRYTAPGPRRGREPLQSSTGSRRIKGAAFGGGR